MRLIHSTAKYVLFFGFVAFFLVGFLGLSHVDMIMGSSDGQMNLNCPFMPAMTALCQMNLLEHLTMWQNAFTAIPSQNNILSLLTSILALTLGVLFILFHATAPPKILSSQRLFTQYRRHIPIFNQIQEAFSSGILHPKVL